MLELAASTSKPQQYLIKVIIPSIMLAKTKDGKDNFQLFWTN